MCISDIFQNGINAVMKHYMFNTLKKCKNTMLGIYKNLPPPPPPNLIFNWMQLKDAQAWIFNLKPQLSALLKKLKIFEIITFTNLNSDRHIFFWLLKSNILNQKTIFSTKKKSILQINWTVNLNNNINFSKYFTWCHFFFEKKKKMLTKNKLYCNTRGKTTTNILKHIYIFS